MKAYKLCLAVILISLLLISNSKATTIWPDTTRVDWDGVLNVLCYEKLVWCVLESGVDSSDFAGFISARTDIVFKWYNFNDQVEVVIVETGAAVPDTAATTYKNSSLVQTAAPMLIDMEFLSYPSDFYYDTDQWYLEVTENNRTDHGDGGAWDADINWSPVVQHADSGGLGQRGHADVKIGVIDRGISIRADTLNHGDLMGNRFHLVKNYGDGEEDDFAEAGSLHGSGVISLIAGNPNNEFRDTTYWGMAGVNGVSPIYVAKVNFWGGEREEATVNQWCTALFDLAIDQGCQIVNVSLGTPNRWPDIFEETFDRLIDEGAMPLLVVSAGDLNNTMVMYPARYAFWGSEDWGRTSGYAQIMSVGGTDAYRDRFRYSGYNSGGHNVSIMAPENTWYTGRNNSEGIFLARKHTIDQSPYFYKSWGTSYSAALVTGVASLVLSEAILNQETLTPAEIRRIIEKTSRDVNYDNRPYFDKRMGYGLVDCYAAVTNRELYSWDIASDSMYYYISSNFTSNDSNLTIGRIVEDLTLNDNTFNNGLQVIKGWDPATQSELVFAPDSQSQDDFDWNVQRMYVVKLKPIDEEDRYTAKLTICGQSVDIDSDITLYDTDVIDGWNWVAYYPDYEVSADSALISIATSGDPDSDLFLAKGYDGSFYSVDWGYCDLTMKPGEGYKMQLDEDRNDILNYPATDPREGAPPNDKKNGSEKLSNSPQHFRFSSRTGDFLPILITGIALRDRAPAEGDEIGIFVADTLCVGAGLWHEGQIGFAAWMDDRSSPRMNGYRNANSLSFRYFDSSENEEIRQVRIETAAAAGLGNPSILVKELNFDGPVIKTQIPEQYRLGPIYPNPFNATTVINYSIPDVSQVSLKLFDSNGRTVRNLFSGTVAAGNYRLTLDGRGLPSGVYIVSMNAGRFNKSMKLEILK